MCIRDRDYIGWHNKAREMDGLAPVWTDEVIAKMKADGTYGETDWAVSYTHLDVYKRQTPDREPCVSPLRT